MTKLEVLQWLAEDFAKHSEWNLDNFQRSRPGSPQRDRYRVARNTWASAANIVWARLREEFPETPAKPSENPGLTAGDGCATIGEQ